MDTRERHTVAGFDLDVLAAIERKVLWLSTAIIDAANSAVRKDPDGLKVGGHQASSASLATPVISTLADPATNVNASLPYGAPVATMSTSIR